MPKSDKVKINVKEKVEDNICDLSLSELEDVPVREIAAFKRVTILDLSSNKLTSLGRNFIILTRLVKLDLSKNEIKSLPDDFGLLQNLRHLDLYNNKLEHLPLSFGCLFNLRYLDLKGNPLTPALAKVVGYCLTAKECQESARNTVKFLTQMQLEAERAKEMHRRMLHDQMQMQQSGQVPDPGAGGEPHRNELKADEKPHEINQKNKSKSKKTKSKQKKSHNTTTNNNNNNNNDHAKDAAQSNATAASNLIKVQRSKRTNNNNNSSSINSSNNTNMKKSNNKSSTALASIFTFFILLAINIVVIYMIMFKNPEIADKLAEMIPHQYRDWILTKTEMFRLCVTDWISEFRTPPEEH